MHALDGRQVKANFSLFCMCLGVTLTEADDAAREDRADFSAALSRREVVRMGWIGHSHGEGSQQRLHLNLKSHPKTRFETRLKG
ncbi:hypothetical protein [Acuticoccus yangtzensis]|uniref:hypothetical protein n=1 Tax=Acuticoccus yangtzensis TaxID=1443441 RepID=UPI0009FB6732|nr:hypothetical protein [Acuticoccus yangtzensis]